MIIMETLTGLIKWKDKLLNQLLIILVEVVLFMIACAMTKIGNFIVGFIISFIIGIIILR